MPPGGPLRILGVDPGSRLTGYGIIEQSGSRLAFVTCGVIRVERLKGLPQRLLAIHQGLSEVIEEYRPQGAAVEDLFTAVNPRSALKLGHARGVIILTAARYGLPVAEYSPRAVKQAVAGYGQAGKEQVQQMVRALLGLSASPSRDAADALAVAICCANHRPF